MFRKIIFLIGLIVALIGCSALNNKPDPETGNRGEPVVVTNHKTNAAANSANADQGNTGDGTPTSAAETIVVGGATASGAAGNGAAPVVIMQEVPATEAPAHPEFSVAAGGSYGQLEGTELVLETELPTGPTVAPVYSQSWAAELPLEEVRALATQFGIPGDIYIQMYPANTEPGVAEGEEGMPKMYYAFGDTYQMSVYGSDVSYNSLSSAYYHGAVEFMPYEQAAAIAEAFLLEQGLLNFPYQIRQSPIGDEVQFLRLIEGYPFLNPEITVGVTADGPISYLNYRAMDNLGAQPEHSLRTAAEAWEMLQASTNLNEVIYNVYPRRDENGQFIYEEPVSGGNEDYRYWPRSFTDGTSVDLYSYIAAYRLAEGDGTPRIQADQYLVTGSDDSLRSLAALVGQQVHLLGIIHETAPGVKMIEVTSFEELGPEGHTDSFWHSGMVERAEGQVLLHADNGETYLIPDAPLELENDDFVYVSGWNILPGDGEYDLLNWQSIERNISATPNLGRVMITQVDLVYQHKGSYAQQDGTQLNDVQPGWRFRGATEQGSPVEIIVKAVAGNMATP